MLSGSPKPAGMLGNVGSGGTGKVSGIAVTAGRGGVCSLVTDALFDGSRAELWVKTFW